MSPDAARPWLRWYRDAERAFSPETCSPYASIPELVAAAAEHGAAPCFSIVLPNGAAATLSYRALDEAADAFARTLIDRYGIETGDVVAIQAPNCLGYPVALIGALRAGAIVSNVNPLYTAFETKRQIADCGAKLLVGFDLFAPVLEEVVEAHPDLPLILLSVTDLFPPARRTLLRLAMRYVRRMVPPLHVPALGLHAVLAEGRRSRTPLAGRAITGDAPCFYQYSGGTTGVSKGVELTARGLLVNMEQATAMSPDHLKRPGRTALLALPLYHMFGLFISAGSMQLGGHVVLIPNPRPLANLKPAFERFQPDIFPGVNALFAGLLEEPWFKADPPRSIEITFSGATSLNEAVAKRWTAATGSLIAESYGMTETTTVLTTNPLDERNRFGTVGLPLPGVDLRIVDRDGQDLPPGEAGEVLARGPQIMRGYRGRAEATEEAFLDGWLRTGDIGVLEPDGYLRIVDRMKDMLIVSGFNVYPNEVEEVIAAVPGVAEVGVVGRPAADKGEEVVAFVVSADANLSADRIAAACRDRLTAYKRPHEVRFVETLPKSPVGKVLRRDLRALL
ncbi:MAG: AMP-binding protein [Pseudomonadota bacterium]